MTLALWCAILAVFLLGAYGYRSINNSLELAAYTRIDDHARFVYKINSLEFCIKNKITDCSEEALYVWNDKHPDNTFKIKTGNALLEEYTDENGKLNLR